MDCLPNDIILPILSCLEVEDICRCGCIARAWAASVHFDPIASRVATESPIAVAKRIGNERIMTLLTERVDAISNDGFWKGYNSLHLAARGGYLQLVGVLLANGFTIDDKSSRGETPLHLAAQNGHYNVVKELICRGCTIDPRDCNMKTPLILAAHQGHIGILIELILQGADVNARDKCGNTALIMGAWYGQSSIVEVLISSGASINMKGQSGKSAIERGKELWHHDVVRILKTADPQESSPVENLAGERQNLAKKNLQEYVILAFCWIYQFLPFRISWAQFVRTWNMG